MIVIVESEHRKEIDMKLYKKILSMTLAVLIASSDCSYVSAQEYQPVTEAVGTVQTVEDIDEVSEPSGEPAAQEVMAEDAAEGEMSYAVEGGNIHYNPVMQSVTGYDGDITAVDLAAIARDNGITIRTIGAHAFYGCSSLMSITVPDGLASIEEYSFLYCEALTEIILPDSVTLIKTGAFSGCKSLNAVRLPGGLTMIDNAVFQNCSSLAEIEFPDTMTGIGTNAFFNCSSLTKAVIPAGATYISTGAFDNCPNLIIYSVKNSMAENYATNHSVPFIILDAGQYGVHFCTNSEGSAITPVVTTAGELIARPEEPERSGYIFAGWYKDDETFLQPWDFEKDLVPAEDITLYAKWEPVANRIIFQPNNGTEPTEQSALSGEKLTKPDDPTYGENVFGGWYKDEELTQEWDFENDLVPGGGLTLYAKWYMMHTVIYESNGGSPVEPAAVRENEKLIKPNDPTRGESVFGGWYRDAECTQEWDFENDRMPGTDMTLYAKWIVPHTVTFVTNADDVLPPDTLSIMPGRLIPVPSCERYGYALVGWYKDDGLQEIWNFDQDVMPDQDMILYAKWTLMDDILEYSFNKKYLTVTGIKEEYRSTVTNVVIPETAADEAWGGRDIKVMEIGAAAFRGCNSLQSVVISRYVTIVGDYAFDNCPDLVRVVVPVNVKTIGSSNPFGSRDYRYLVGGEDGVYSKVVLYLDRIGSVAYRYAQENNIPYVIEGSGERSVYYETVGGDNRIAPQIVAPGGKLTAPEKPSRFGYAFAGWYREISCTQWEDDTTYQYSGSWDFENDAMPDEDITLFARWEKVKSYNVIYQFGDGIEPVIRENPERSLITPYTPVREGYVFLGWYQDQALTQPWDYGKDMMPSHDITLYAKWREEKFYTVTFALNGGYGVPSQQRVAAGTLIPWPAAPERSGYEFEGWFRDPEFTTAWNFAVDLMPDSDLTLYAKWTAMFASSDEVTVNSFVSKRTKITLRDVKPAYFVDDTTTLTLDSAAFFQDERGKEISSTNEICALYQVNWFVTSKNGTVDLHFADGDSEESDVEDEEDDKESGKSDTVKGSKQVVLLVTPRETKTDTVTVTATFWHPQLMDNVVKTLNIKVAPKLHTQTLHAAETKAQTFWKSSKGSYMASYTAKASIFPSKGVEKTITWKAYEEDGQTEIPGAFNKNKFTATVSAEEEKTYLLKGTISYERLDGGSGIGEDDTEGEDNTEGTSDGDDVTLETSIALTVYPKAKAAKTLIVTPGTLELGGWKEDSPGLTIKTKSADGELQELSLEDVMVSYDDKLLSVDGGDLTANVDYGFTTKVTFKYFGKSKTITVKNYTVDPSLKLGVRVSGEPNEVKRSQLSPGGTYSYEFYDKLYASKYNKGVEDKDDRWKYGDGGDEVEISNVTVSLDKKLLKARQNGQFILDEESGEFGINGTVSGTMTLTLKGDPKKRSCKLKIGTAKTGPSNLSIETDEGSAVYGEGEEGYCLVGTPITLISVPEDGSADATWKVSDSKVATIKGNNDRAVLTFKKAGTITVTATSKYSYIEYIEDYDEVKDKEIIRKKNWGKKSATMTITVKDLTPVLKLGSTPVTASTKLEIKTSDKSVSTDLTVGEVALDEDGRSASVVTLVKGEYRRASGYDTVWDGDTIKLRANRTASVKNTYLALTGTIEGQSATIYVPIKVKLVNAK